MRLKLRGKLVEVREEYIIIAAGFILSIAVFAYGFYNYFGTPRFLTFVFFSAFLFFAPLGVAMYLRYRRIREMEYFFPQFLRDLADAARAGTTLPRAVLSVSKINYGVLTTEVKKLAAHISWGVPFDEALRSFAKRTGSKMISASVELINEAYLAGGNVPDILDTVAEDARKMHEMKEERRARFSGFIATIYTVFIVFLLITSVITVYLLPEIPTMPFIGGVSLFGSSTMGPVGISEDELRTILFHIALIEALFSGLLAGMVGEGSLVSGVKHSLIMIFIAIVFFQTFVPYPDPVDRLGRAVAKTSPFMTTTVFVGSFYVEENITSADVVESARRYVESMTTLKDVIPEYNIIFEAVDCAPCEAGEIVVDKNGIYVKEPAYLRLWVATEKGEMVHVVRVS